MKPTIGMGLTLKMYSDRHAYTITEVSPSGKTFTAKRLKAIRTDAYGMSESQYYRFEPDPDGDVQTFRLRKDKLYHCKLGVAVLGLISAYHDYSF